VDEAEQLGVALIRYTYVRARGHKGGRPFQAATVVDRIHMFDKD
jgi:hypothetical protein